MGAAGLPVSDVSTDRSEFFALQDRSSGHPGKTSAFPIGGTLHSISRRFRLRIWSHPGNVPNLQSLATTRVARPRRHVQAAASAARDGRRMVRVVRRVAEFNPSRAGEGDAKAPHAMRQRRPGGRGDRGAGSAASMSGGNSVHVDCGSGWLTAHRSHLASLAVAAAASVCYVPSLRNQFAFDDRSVHYCSSCVRVRPSKPCRADAHSARRRSKRTWTCDPRHPCGTLWSTISGARRCARTCPTNPFAR